MVFLMDTCGQRKVLARFRAKKSYLIRKKGLSEVEAIEQAQHILKDLDDTTRLSVNQKPSRLLKPVQDPSAKEIKAEVKRQKALGTFIEVPLLMSSAEQPAQSAPTLKLAKSQSAEQPEQNAERRKAQSADTSHQLVSIASALFCGLIVAIASWLLVSSSLEVFGTGPEGWGKAILLELGILGLAVSKLRFGRSLKEKAHFVLTKGTLVFLVFLSFAVLHTGVESQRSDNLNTVKTNNTTLTELTNERDSWQKTYDSYAENRISDRRDAMKEISRLNEAIRAERAAISQSLDSSVINLKSNTEMMIRAALLLLNIIFGHKLAQTVATVKWPPLREEGLVS